MAPTKLPTAAKRRLSLVESDSELLEALARYDTPTLANAIETFAVRPFSEGFAGPQIRCIFPALPRLVGYAVTAKISARQPPSSGRPSAGNGALYEHTLMQPRPRVAVVADLDAPESAGSLWGEVHATIFNALDCEGVVTDGVVRDLPEVEAIGFRYFAAGVGVSHAYVTVEEVGCEVCVGGLTVRPGDLIHADVHGVLSIPHEIAAALPQAADELVAREQSLISWVRSADFDPARILEMRAAH
jgi:4-hydroxy-4-methyl-2-oxoglutarate aldolase